MYDPVIGRFVSQDPVEGYANLPQSQNPYSYSYNDPVNENDPSGKDARGLCFQCGGGIGAYAGYSVCGVRTDSGQLGLTFSLGVGGTTGAGGSVGIGYMHDKKANKYQILLSKKQ